MSIDPDEIHNEQAYVYINIADVRIRQFGGQVLGVTTGRARTEIRVVTGGYWLDKQRFPAVVSYANVSPSAVCSALSAVAATVRAVAAGA